MGFGDGADDVGGEVYRGAGFVERDVFGSTVMTDLAELGQVTVGASQMCRPTFLLDQIPMEGRFDGSVFAERSAAEGKVG
jgi:hypothetical protein